jgi:PTS system mannose-specific IID component
MPLALINTFIRSFFLQTLWNFERLQNAGFAFCMVPLLERLGLSRESLLRLIRRQLDFFNTHPYFAPIVMGVVFSQEKVQPSDAQENRTLKVLKDSMGGAFGAVGDHVIWGTWRPFCIVAALCAGVLVTYKKNDWHTCALYWITGFLILFNILHIWLRWHGLHKAVAEGPAVVRWVESLHLQTWTAQVRRIGLVALAALTLFYLKHWATSRMLLWMISVMLGSVVLKRWAVSSVFIFYGACSVAIAMVSLGVH